MATLRMPSYDLVVDTNALFCRTPKHLVSPGFDAELARVREITSVTLFVPDIVRGELVARRVRLALKSRESLQKAGDNLREYTGFSCGKLPSESAIRQRVLRQFEDWLRRNEGAILPPPKTKGMWQRIVNDAIWRRPPFESPADDEGKSNEKGFKDALVCETVVKHAKARSSKSTVFVCNDGLLREAVTARLTGTDAVVMASVGEFASHLEFLKEHKTSEYAQEIVAAAAAAYYTPDKPDCLFHAFDIPVMIEKEFASILEHPVDQPSPLLPKRHGFASLLDHPVKQPPSFPANDLLSGLSIAGSLFPVSEEKYYHRATNLSDLKNGRIHWITTQILVRLFERRQPPAKVAFTLPFSDERIRVARVAVEWSSDFGKEPIISNPKLEAVKWIGEELEAADFANKAKYDLPLFRQFGQQTGSS
jgi:hypothetical protein